MNKNRQKMISNGLNKYIFILGQSPELSRQEIIHFFKDPIGSVIDQGDIFSLVTSHCPAEALLLQLGGTVKIASWLDKLDSLNELNTAKWQGYLAKKLSPNKKNNFAFSLYNDSAKNYQLLKATALQLKKELKNNGYNCRLVIGRSAELSSVIVKKNNLVGKELIIIKNKDHYLLGLTEAVQDFVKYGQLDMARPCRDDKSGMLPPKIAQLMINLAGPDRDKTILDPFCGSGTILQQAMILGFKKIYGTDLSKKAVSDSQQNLHWTKETFHLNSNYQIQKADVKNLGETFKNHSIDLIVTEPFMGEARFVYRQNRISALQNTKSELQNLYINAFKQFKKILAPGGQVVFIFPIFEINRQQLTTFNQVLISQLGFANLLAPAIIYRRPRQKVLRQITLHRMK